MTAERLRQAATKLREVVEAATPGPWVADTVVRGDCVVWGPRRNDRDGKFICNSEAEPHWTHNRAPAFDADVADTTYIALMHPPVALALAEMLESVAHYPDANIHALLLSSANHLADAILGES